MRPVTGGGPRGGSGRITAREGAVSPRAPGPRPGGDPRWSSAPPRMLAALAALLLAAGCGGGEGPPADASAGDSLEGLDGATLVTGSSPREWGLLAVPRSGGRAQVRSVRDPSRVVWTGETDLPAAEEIHLLDGPLVILRTPAGAVHRYDPRSEELARVGEVGDAARWAGGGRSGVWIEGDAARLLEIGPDGAWRYELAGRPAWAAPAGEGAMAVLVARDDDPADLWLVSRGESEPRSRADRSYALPAIVTAWGKRLAAGDPGGDVLRIAALPSLTPTGEVPLPGPMTAMAVSPSSHEIYVGVGSPPRLIRVSRFTAEAEVMTTVEEEIREIRPATLGSFLLVHGTGGPVWVPLEGGAATRLEGAWRADLPLGTPDGRVLLAGEDGLRAWDPGGGASEPVSAPADLWWAAVHWNPAPPAVVSRAVAETASTSPGAPGEEADAIPPPDSPSAPVAARGGGGEPPSDSAAEDSPAGGAEVPPGHYAVAAAARQQAGVRRLLESLSEAGYPTALQQHRDDAGRLWHRGMVGPYPSRDDAEAAARQLRRERDLSVWITEVRAGTSAEEIFP